MREGPDIARVANLIGDPARAHMLTALMSGKALTATELAGEAGVTLQTASGHLAKLADGHLVQARKQGRHKYFALAHADVATTLEALMGLAAGQGKLRTRTGPKDAAMRQARVCYNHLAGQMGVQMFESLKTRAYVVEGMDDIRLTASGAAFARDFGIDVDALENARAPLCRSCLDWSERRTHLAGSLGRAMLTRMEEAGWVRRDRDSRVLLFNPKGLAAFDAAFPKEKDTHNGVPLMR
ncbi:MAG: winged helix-turn-helix domain-containing protein [Pseudomonadota bacterium]